MNVTEIQDYFEGLCEKHKDLLHNDNGKRAFARLSTDSHIDQIKKNGTKNIVVVSEVNGTMYGELEAKTFRNGFSLFVVCSASRSGNAGTAIDVAMGMAYEIMMDLLARMFLDGNEMCSIPFELEKAKWDDIEGPWLDN